MARKDAGLTLIETLIALLVVGVLVTMAHALFQSAVAKARVAETQERLQSGITASMRHAVITGNRVVMCPSLDGGNCTGGSDWSEGWISFVDLDRNRLRSPEEPLLGSLSRPSQGVMIFSNTGRPRLVFLANGTNPGTNATFIICNPKISTAGTAVVLANSGQLRQARAAGEVNDQCQGRL